MKYEVFKKKTEEMRKAEEDFIRNLCVDNFIKILSRLDYEYEIVFSGYCIKLKDYDIVLGLDIDSNEKYYIGYKDYGISDNLFQYGELVGESVIKKQLENIIEISKIIKL